MATITTAPLTLEEFSQLPDDGVRHEISEGELITMSGPKSLHSRIIRKVGKAIETALAKSGYGEAFPEAGYVLSRDPLTVRQPDVSVLSPERIQSTAPDDYLKGRPSLLSKLYRLPIRPKISKSKSNSICSPEQNKSGYSIRKPSASTFFSQTAKFEFSMKPKL
jgi:hypothetical protein